MESSDLALVLGILLSLTDSSKAVPRKIIIHWLNLLPQRESFMILAGSGIGMKREGFDGDIRLTLPLREPRFLRPGGRRWSSSTILLFVSLLENVTFINFGAPIGNKYYKEFVIYDFQCVKDLIYIYRSFVPFLHVWTGGDENAIIPFWAHFAMFSRYPLTVDDYKVTYPVQFEASKDFNLCFNHPFFQRWRSKLNENLLPRLCMFQHIRSLEISMTVDQYTNYMSHMQDSFSNYYARPVNLCVRLSFDANDTESPPNFPIRWITDTFITTEVESFALHYFAPNTQFSQLFSLLSKMPHLHKLILSFGYLEISEIVQWAPKTKKCLEQIQLKIARNCFKLLPVQEVREQWSTFFLDEYVLLNYIKKKSRWHKSLFKK
ncbi:hypothetical protein CANMA_002120 [Candida margitis]|uniref:uncharacterized protein n=1 Tax=Candida margitis TaxID=1775924 RepID=UPI0022264445|nr:uncharacterized protein CANMA_002120 [Candida margitis]KAI5968684.1 hypothetical protein CANMA_002120 [Candida margitis]